ncbi:hypothetical protein GcC1_c10386o5 [Golovinomyces cichoracearum]|uniref:Uncharacterized protein n=1 Tax=Golovinomyces cichoracearum TaxID=62708 RepID=A0A420J9C2_9PEZI|nr:hypothetical protein GcC1_c10386o5 [Golovinomyces cichoracearum]
MCGVSWVFQLIPCFNLHTVMYQCCDINGVSTDCCLKKGNSGKYDPKISYATVICDKD